MGRHRSRSMSSSSSGRGVQSSKWDGKSGHRLHVSDLAAGISRREVERAFAKFGSVNEVWVATNPPCFAFVNFNHRSDAEKALREVDGKVIGSTRVGVTWARERTFGGRSRRSLGTASSSYRSSAGGRRRSRSRSRSNPRREKRRPSRSRSPDRQRRRSESPRDRKRSRKEGNGDDRRKSKRTPSPSKQQSPNHSKNGRRSHDSTNNADITDSPPPNAGSDANNAQNRATIIVDSE